MPKGLGLIMELVIGIEPTTTGLQNQGSTIELHQHNQTHPSCNRNHTIFLQGAREERQKKS